MSQTPKTFILLNNGKNYPETESIYAYVNAERGNCKGTTWWMLPSLPSLSLPAVASSQKYKFKQNRN